MTYARLPRRAWGAALLLPALLLPAMAAGARLDAPAAPGEIERLRAAVAMEQDPASLVADAFLRLSAPSSWPPAGDAGAIADALCDGRLAQLLGLLGISLLAFLCVTLAGGRLRALLALLFLAAMPAVSVEGHVLRPETLAVLFSLLALLLLQLMAKAEAPSAARLRKRSVLALGATAAVATAFATAAWPARAFSLLVPGLVAAFALGMVMLRLLRAARRRDLAALPLRAAAQRLWPWAMASLLAMVASGLLLTWSSASGAEAFPSDAQVGLLPQSPVLRWPLLALALAGALHGLLRTGRRLGRSARPGPDLVLLAYMAAALLLHCARDDSEDSLAAALPVAVLCADGCVRLLLTVAALRSGPLNRSA